jgi:hypothetical protein
MNDLPRSTVRELAIILVATFDLAIERGRRFAARIRPLVEPPEDLRITTHNGALYSGVLLLERGDVIAGLVIQTGQTTPSAPFAPPSVFSSPSRHTPTDALARRDEGRLPHWSEDRSLYDDGEPPWRR